MCNLKQPLLAIFFRLQTASLFLKNPIIRIFCISGWLSVPINRDKWSYTIFPFKVTLDIASPIAQDKQ